MRTKGKEEKDSHPAHHSSTHQPDSDPTTRLSRILASRDSLSHPTSIPAHNPELRRRKTKRDLACTARGTPLRTSILRDDAQFRDCVLPLILRVFGQCEGYDEVDPGKGCGGFLLSTLTTSVVGSEGPNAKSCARVPGCGGSIPFRGVGVRVGVCWSSCECEIEMALFSWERCGSLFGVGRGSE